MTFDISYLWIWLVLSAIIGGVVAWRSHVPGPQAPVFEGWVRRAAYIWVLAVVAALLHLLSGRVAFWLESAVLFFAAYVLGALIGGAARDRRAKA
jgi:Ca2+/Na+ antiporter